MATVADAAQAFLRALRKDNPHLREVTVESIGQCTEDAAGLVTYPIHLSNGETLKLEIRYPPH